MIFFLHRKRFNRLNVKRSACFSKDQFLGPDGQQQQCNHSTMLKKIFPFVFKGDFRSVEACKHSANSQVIFFIIFFLPSLDNLIVRKTENSGFPLATTAICPLNFKCPVAWRTPNNYVSDTFQGSKNEDLATVSGVFCFFYSPCIHPQLRISMATPSVGGPSIMSAEWRIRVGVWRFLL